LFSRFHEIWVLVSPGTRIAEPYLYTKQEAEMGDNKEPVTKPEETADTTLPEKELEEVVGGTSTGKHIKDVTIEVVRAGGDKVKY
jgi:hypothetical protein